jgi:hypothetical protein
MKAINLSKNLHALVDDDVWFWLHHWKWSVTKFPENVWYARRKMLNPTTQKSIFIYLHKVISGVTKDYSVTFRDSNPLNLQRENICIRNGRKKEITWDGSRSESLFRGVVWDAYYGLWKAHLKNLPIGYYVTEFEAALAYNDTATKILGDDIDINNIESVCTEK